MSDSIQELELKVSESYTRDVGRGMARIDYASMDKLGASTGDVLLLKAGERTVLAKALPLYPSDEEKGLLRTDSLVRQNLGIAIGSDVKVSKVRAEVARMIVFSPLEKIPPVQNEYLADALESQALKVGMTVMIPYFGGRLTFEVTKTVPGGPVLMHERTKTYIVEDNIIEEPGISMMLRDPAEPKPRKIGANCKRRNHAGCVHQDVCECTCHKGIAPTEANAETQFRGFVMGLLLYAKDGDGGKTLSAVQEAAEGGIVATFNGKKFLIDIEEAKST